MLGIFFKKIRKERIASSVKLQVAKFYMSNARFYTYLTGQFVDLNCHFAEISGEISHLLDVHGRILYKKSAKWPLKIHHIFWTS